jgi:hypothetical protein
VRRPLRPTWLQAGPHEPRQRAVSQPTREDLGRLA